MTSTLRWLAGALLGPICAFVVVLQIPAEQSGQATTAGMANIAYLLIFVRHLILFGILYGLVLPVLLPKPSTQPLPSIAIGGIIGATLLIPLYGQLDLSRVGGADHFSDVTWRNSIIAVPASLLTTFFVGLRNNRALANATYWSRILRRP